MNRPGTITPLYFHAKQPMITHTPLRLTHDLFSADLLFAALGGMTWAVRGCSGFGAHGRLHLCRRSCGAPRGWFIAHDPTREQSRRYASGVDRTGAHRGHRRRRGSRVDAMAQLFEGTTPTNYAKGEFVPISKIYGFVWLFIAGMPWAGLGACLLAWCGSLRETRVWHWVIRIACGMAGATLARYLFDTYPQTFLPLYESLESRYKDFENQSQLEKAGWRQRLAIYHMGWYLGFLLFEVARREWKNVVLILTVGVVNGAGWALCQNWKWAPDVWPNSNFNFWRCWESSGGISIGIALGIAYFPRESPNVRQGTGDSRGATGDFRPELRVAARVLRPHVVLKPLSPFPDGQLGELLLQRRHSIWPRLLSSQPWDNPQPRRLTGRAWAR